ncbi:prohead protease/major capsid protein fusion protein [Rhizobium rhizogenes]|uniref:prohead protease/major capsid protein fusion protein n=1 Tax=Rhizobium rhizogenes TaxID=359 RepID=UPI0022BD9210|nr:prohead protease/major capsid protein fusion protein [Rhizobium rhizogenes]MCZ7480920.1 HK97 family phage prohead protease [Rhizobium rhizogenes]
MPRRAVRKAAEAIHRDNVFTPRSLDDEQRTIEVVAATETPVLRWGFNEVLKCTRSAVIATRLKGLPVIDSHDRSSVLSVLGQVTAYRVEQRQLIATIKFADSERGRQAFELVKSGMLNKVSVGYTIRNYEETDAKNGSALLTVTEWEPFELSLVSVPADHNATVRGASTVKNPRRRNGPALNDEAEDLDLDVRNRDDDEEYGDDIRSRRQTRSATFSRQIDELRSQGVRAGLKPEAIDEELNGVRTMSRAREIVMDMLADQSTRTPSSSVHRGQDTSQADFEAQIIDAVAERLGAPAPERQDNPLRNRSLVEIGRNFYQRAGFSVQTMDDTRIAEFMLGGEHRATRAGGYAGSGHTTSDFTLLLDNAANRALLSRFSGEGSPIKKVATKRNARDFRRQTFIRPGEAPKLEKILESGEIKNGTVGEDARGLKLETYARIFALSRQAIINDDLGAFSDFIRAFADSAAVTEGDLLYELLSANAFGGAKYSDNKNFFHADHGNLASSGAALSIGSLDAGRKAMRTQKSVNGDRNAGVVPSVLMVGPAKETEAQRLVAEINATTTTDVNPFAGKLQVEVENRYPGNGWWLFADPASAPALAYGYLDGREGPFIDTDNGWRVLGTEFRCVLDFGCAPFDPRAAYFNPGE